MSTTRRFLIALAVFGAAMLAACEAPNPQANTPTSGRLILFVDENYVPLVRQLADSFAVLSPNAKIEIHSASARTAIEQLLRAEGDTTTHRDTSSSYAAIIGRRLLADESKVIDDAGAILNEYVIGYDGIVAVVSPASTMRSTTVERLRNAMKSTVGGYLLDLDSTNREGVRMFILPDQNSSTFMVARQRLLGDSNISAPVRYFQTVDSVVARTAAGDGVGIMSWYRANRDSSRLKFLRLGYTDSTHKYVPPTRVHVTTLVTDTYPLKQPIVGYTLAPPKSLAIGFLTWVARSDIGQRMLVEKGLQPENMKLRLVMPEQQGE